MSTKPSDYAKEILIDLGWAWVKLVEYNHPQFGDHSRLTIISTSPPSARIDIIGTRNLRCLQKLLNDNLPPESEEG